MSQVPGPYHPFRWDRRPEKKWRLKSKYGMSIKAWEKLYEIQDGKCAICQAMIKRQQAFVDHNHKNGEVRGLLGHSCNSLLGTAKDSIEILQSAISYLYFFR